MRELIQIEDNKDLARDPKTKAILRVDTKAFEQHKRKKEFRNSVAFMKNDLEMLKDELADIKNLLKQILNDG